MIFNTDTWSNREKKCLWPFFVRLPVKSPQRKRSPKHKPQSRKIGVKREQKYQKGRSSWLARFVFFLCSFVVYELLVWGRIVLALRSSWQVRRGRVNERVGRSFVEGRIWWGHDWGNVRGILDRLDWRTIFTWFRLFYDGIRFTWRFWSCTLNRALGWSRFMRGCAESDLFGLFFEKGCDVAFPLRNRLIDSYIDSQWIIESPSVLSPIKANHSKRKRKTHFEEIRALVSDFPHFLRNWITH